jgi:hypothetical protein
MNGRAFQVNAWHRCGAALSTSRTWGVMAELQSVILSVLSIKDDYKSQYDVYPPEGHTYTHNSPLYQHGAAKLAVDKAIS